MGSQGLAEFREALIEMGTFNAVLTFTISDFARTLTSNGKGSDHGWGGHHMVMGGTVEGGSMYGEFTRRCRHPVRWIQAVARYIPTTSTEEYFAELALWFDVSHERLG